MKNEYLFNFGRDERISIFLSIQRTKTRNFSNWYFSFLAWVFSVIIIPKKAVRLTTDNEISKI